MVTANNPKQKSKPKKVNNLRHAEYYDMQPAFDDIFAKSANGENFHKLMHLILSRDNILLAYRNIKGNDGSVTPGTDGLTIKDVAKFSPDEMVQKIRNITGNYNPRAVRRKEIPKAYNPGKTRPLGIPCIWDRLVQQCILQVLEPICEAQFSDNSYGFRPNRSCENAMSKVYNLMQLSHLQYVVEFDVKGFFDNVDHSKLIKQMWAMGIRDTKLIYLVKQILKAPVQLENGTIERPLKGTPQGGVISPLLANIVLNELDKWVESQWQNSPVIGSYQAQRDARGGPIKSHAYRAMRKTKLKEMYIVRYADDFRIFCRKREDAEKTLNAVTQWLKERLRLDVSPEKTRVVNLRKQYSEFLGFKIKLIEKGKKLVVKSHVCDKALKHIQQEAKQKMRDIRRPSNGKTEVQAIIAYNAFVVGIHNYYQIATVVSQDFDKVNYQIAKIAKHLGRRLKRKPKVERHDEIVERYGGSAQLRWVANLPIAPIGYVQMK